MHAELGTATDGKSASCLLKEFADREASRGYGWRQASTISITSKRAGKILWKRQANQANFQVSALSGWTRSVLTVP